MTTCVFSPTEVTNRDLDFQIVLAALYAQRVAPRRPRFFFGRMAAVFRATRDTRGGIYVGKAFDPFFPHTDLTGYRAMKERGFVVLHLDDEGAVFPGDENEWRTTLKRRLDPNAIATDDFVCTWGDWQRDLYLTMNPPAARNIRTTGHPRFDLLLPKMRAYNEEPTRALKERYGDFVLLNTNLSTANNGLGLEYTFSKRWGYDPAVPAKRHGAVNFWAHSMRIFVNFVQLVHDLSDALGSTKIVVRPHPSEDQETYRLMFAGLPNVEVIHEGSVVPWLLASRALLHDGCTTGIEAALCGTPVINFKSVADERYDLYLPNLFGFRSSTVDDVLRLLKERPEPPPAPLTQKERDLFLNFSGPTYDRLLSVMEEADGNVPEPRGYDARRGNPKQHAAAVMEKAKAVLRPLSRKHRLNARYSSVKVKPLSNASIPDRIAWAERVTGIRLKAEIISDELVALDPA
jgi:surface carbohydrate biosynthesis protein